MSVSPEDRMIAAEIRAIDAHKSVARNANKVLEELDHITDVGFRPEIHEEDSAVHAIEVAAEANSRVAAGQR